MKYVVAGMLMLMIILYCHYWPTDIDEWWDAED